MKKSQAVKELGSFLSNLAVVKIGDKTKAELIITFLEEELRMLPPVDKKTDKCKWERE